DPKSGGVPTSTQLGTFVYTIATDAFVEIGPRAVTLVDIGRFPTFTDYDSTLAPSSLVFASALNFRADGTFPPIAEDASGLNPGRAPQLFLAALPAGTTQSFVRLTNTPLGPAFRGTNFALSET